MSEPVAGGAKKTAQLLRELSEELDEEKSKRLKLEKCAIASSLLQAR
jgi:hypothetical protein